MHSVTRHQNSRVLSTDAKTARDPGSCLNRISKSKDLTPNSVRKYGAVFEGNRITRVIFGIVRNRMVILHGFVKKTQNTAAEIWRSRTKG